MGLDVYIFTENHEELLSAEYFDEKNDYVNKHWLSRTFCNFMCRRDSYGEPELDQIGRISGVDISPLYEMEKNFDEDYIMHQLSFAKNEAEKEGLSKQIQADKDNLKDNIDLVLKTINLLIYNLTNIDHIEQKLNCGIKDTLGYDYYFTDFNIDRSESYTENNFGQDLRNIKRFLEFAKANGRTTVWFHYG